MSGSLNRRTALVTGAAGVIGAAVATRLAAEGARVIVCDLDAGRAEVVAAALPDGLGIPTPGDVTSPDSMAAVIAVAEAAGGLDVLVNVAGIVRDAPLHRMTDEEWRAVHEVGLYGAFNVCRAAAPLLRAPADHHRKVVNLTSNVGLHGAPGTANYAAAKAGLIGLTKTLAREWARRQINVNAVAPGLVTGAGTTEVKPAELIARVEAQIPIGRAATPEDVAGAIAFLAGPDSDIITGQVLELSGGLEVPH